jgi:hypothetical protein
VSVQFTEASERRVNPLKAKLNSICHLLALLGAHPILHISRIRVKKVNVKFTLEHAMKAQMGGRVTTLLLL